MKNMKAEELIVYPEAEVAELIEQFVQVPLESTNVTWPMARFNQQYRSPSGDEGKGLGASC